MTRPFPRRLSAVLIPLLASAFVVISCGGSAENSGGGGGGDGDGDGDGDAPGDGDGDGDGDAMCDAFLNDSPRHLEIEIRNERSETIHIGPRVETCGTVPPFEVEDERGRLLQTDLGGCMPLCADYISGNNLGCPAICLYPEVIVIQPGESHVAAWDTRRGVPLELPAECNAADTVDIECLAARAIDPGTFTFLSRAGTSVTCSTPCDDCGPDGAGCPGQLIVSGEELSAEATVNLDESYGIYPATQGDAPTPGAINSVELVFTE